MRFCLGNGVCVRTKRGVFDGKVDVDDEGRELLCVGNKVKRNAKLLLVAKKEQANNVMNRADPDVVIMERRMTC